MRWGIYCSPASSSTRHLDAPAFFITVILSTILYLDLTQTLLNYFSKLSLTNSTNNLFFYTFSITNTLYFLLSLLKMSSLLKMFLFPFDDAKLRRKSERRIIFEGFFLK